jgi:F0F1-type ATP synthase delta subunit
LDTDFNELNSVYDEVKKIKNIATKSDKLRDVISNGSHQQEYIDGIFHLIDKMGLIIRNYLVNILKIFDGEVG